MFLISPEGFTWYKISKEKKNRVSNCGFNENWRTVVYKRLYCPTNCLQFGQRCITSLQSSILKQNNTVQLMFADNSSSATILSYQVGIRQQPSQHPERKNDKYHKTNKINPYSMILANLKFAYCWCLYVDNMVGLFVCCCLLAQYRKKCLSGRLLTLYLLLKVLREHRVQLAIDKSYLTQQVQSSNKQPSERSVVVLNFRYNVIVAMRAPGKNDFYRNTWYDILIKFQK